MIKMIRPAFVFLTLALNVNGAYAAEGKAAGEGQSSMTVEDATQSKNKVAGDIDAEITNAKLRAESGSKSKFSLSIKGQYTGGSIESAFGQKRPRLAADPSSQDFTSLDMGLNARYRSTKNDSFTAGTAFGFVTPFQGRVSTKDAINVNDPNIAYSRVGKVYDLQSVATASYAYGTSINSLAIDETHQVGLSYNMMKQFESRLSVGASAAFGYNLFSTAAGENKNARTATYGRDARLQATLGIFPQAEYAFNDKLSARTVFGYFNWKHLYGDQNHYRLLQTYVYQSIGIGWAVARDIYLYPNVQFVPSNIRSDFTNVALAATINLF